LIAAMSGRHELRDRLIFFTAAGDEAYLEVLPKAEMHRLDAGHFAVEDCLGYISGHMHKFYDSTVAEKR
jgi:hypothetical protein